MVNLDRVVRQAGVRDAEAIPVQDHPYLRVDRFLGSFKAQFGTPASRSSPAFAAWVDRMARLADSARHLEIANLPAHAIADLEAGTRAAVLDRTDECAAALQKSVMARPETRAALVEVVRSPDEYADWVRVLGLYPLTAFPVGLGFDRWKTENLGSFAVDPRSLPFDGARRVYGPGKPIPKLDAAQVAGMIEAASDNPLGIPEPAPEVVALLVDQFAPVWVVDTAGEADRPGSVGWVDRTLTVDPVAVRVYTRMSHTRAGAGVLLQISYLIWFPARPASSSMDLLAGAFDGILWRVTLGTDGVPLLYDSIHACGCYHLFFPVPPLTAKRAENPVDLTEYALAPMAGPVPAPGQRVFIRLATGSHYIRGIHTDTAGNWSDYDLVSDHALRSLPMSADERQSMFGPDGLVDGSERGERFLLWPMGIQSPGAMRQWGTHATAFVGRRHFDDPWMIPAYFRHARDGEAP